MNFLRAKVILLTFMFLLISCKDNAVQSDDKGEWQLLGLGQESITAIAVDPSDENIIYAGSTVNYLTDEYGGLFKSIDGGASWDTLINSTIIREIDVHPTNPQIIYVLGGSVLVSKTTNGGKTWMAADSGLHLSLMETPGVLAIDPLYPDTVYVGTTDFGGGRLYKSTNGGVSWRKIGESDIIYGGVTALAIDPDNSNILYVGTDMTGAILKSSDGGATWNRLDFPEVGIVNDLLVHPAHSEIIYAGTWGYGFYFSKNGGTSWQTASSGLLDTSQVLKIDLSSTQIYVVVSFRDTGAVYMSSKDHISWDLVGGDGFDHRAETIVYNTLLEKLYMGGKGIYSFDLAE